jgi:cysteine desulfurase
MDPIYLDHAATTPVRREVLEAMLPFFGERFGNPSSMHRWGREARVALDEARERVAACLGAHTDEIIFTSCGTEGDNLAVLGAWRAQRERGRRAVATTPIEHKAVLAAAHQAESEGAELRLLPVSCDGVVDMDAIRDAMDDHLAICSVMWINNEIGTIQPIPEIAALARENGVVFHTDAVQALGKVEIDVRKLPVGMLAVSGHKIGAPKGVGALFIRRGTPMQPLFFGGGQDRGRRPGTENVAYAVGLATAAELAVAEREEECARLRAMRERLEQAILQQVPDAIIHGREAERAPHIINISIPECDAESLLMALDMRGVAASAGSACQSGAASASHVLTALGVDASEASSALRLSLGSLTTEEHVTRVSELLPALVNKARGRAAVA